MLDFARQMRLVREVMMSATMRPSYNRLKCCVAISLSMVILEQIRWVKLNGCQETFVNMLSRDLQKD